MAVLPLATASLPDVYYYNSLTLCVLDSVFSIGVRYEGTEAVVKRYCAAFGLNRIRASRPAWPPPAAQEPLSALVERVEAVGSIAFATTILRNRQRTSSKNGILKAEAAAEFARVLHGFGIKYFQDLPTFHDDGQVQAALRRVRGQRSGISVSYFWMLAGSEDLIKPDRMILGFLRETLGQAVSMEQATVLLRRATTILQREIPHLTPRLLDHEVWRFQRARRAL